MQALAGSILTVPGGHLCPTFLFFHIAMMSFLIVFLNPEVNYRHSKTINVNFGLLYRPHAIMSKLYGKIGSKYDPQDHKHQSSVVHKQRRSPERLSRQTKAIVSFF